MNYTKREISSAFHESGHILAMHLVGEKFKTAVIIQGKIRDINDGKADGNVIRENPIDELKWRTMSFFDPKDNDGF